MSAVSKVLIIGGGIGGLTAAIAFRQVGIEVDLVEKEADWTVYGVGIIQPNNTLRALEKIGLAQRCVDVGAAYPGWRIFDVNGGLLMEAPATSDAAPAYPPINGITRPVLHEILLKGTLDAGVSIKLGVTAETLDDQGETVEVLFTDGTSGTYDFVVCCDGLFSGMRQKVFGTRFESKFSGQAVWRYNFPRPSTMEWGEIHCGPRNKLGLVPLTSDLMYMFLVTAEPGNPRMPKEKLAEAMRERLADYGGEIAKLRDQITDSEAVVYRPMQNILITDPWMKGRVILIGDAAHTTTPHLAQGAAMAIEDAVLLGELLGRDEPLDKLLAEFMKRRFDRVKFVVESSTQIAQWEMEEWQGISNPDAEPGKLLYSATQTLMEEY